MISKILKARAIMLIICSITIENAMSQTQQPTLSQFFDGLQKINPIEENLSYDSVPDFDFDKLEPLQKNLTSGIVSYVLGLDRKQKIRTIAFIDGHRRIGTMEVYELQFFKILIFKKESIVLTKYPDFPIFCISSDSRFIVYLNKEFKYQKQYKCDDIAAIQILRNDLFPVYALAIRKNYIRMVTEIKYVNGASKIVDKLRVIINFQPEQDSNQLITARSQFSEDCILPREDFGAMLPPRIKNIGLPGWLYAPTLGYE